MGEFFNTQLRDGKRIPDPKITEQMRKDWNAKIDASTLTIESKVRRKRRVRGADGKLPHRKVGE